MSSLTIILSACTLNSLFFCLLAVERSLLVRFKTIRLAIERLATLRVLCSRVSLGELKVRWRNKNISSRPSETYFTFVFVGVIWLQKKRVWIGILALGKVSLSVWLAYILLKRVERLYGISPVACNGDCIFRVVLACCRALCIKEMKSALSMLYIVNCILSTSNVLYFFFKGLNIKRSRGCNKCVECIGRDKHIILCSCANRIILVDTQDGCLSTIKIQYPP